MNSFLIRLLVIYQALAVNWAAPIELFEANGEFVKNNSKQTEVTNGFDNLWDHKLISITLPSLNEIKNLKAALIDQENFLKKESDSTATASVKPFYKEISINEQLPFTLENSIESFTEHFEDLEETTSPVTASTQNIESSVTATLDRDIVNSSNSKEAKNLVRIAETETTAEQPNSTQNITNNFKVDNKQQITQQTQNLSKQEILKDLKPAINVPYTPIGLENFVKNLSQISNHSEVTNKNITDSYISVAMASDLDSKTNSNNETILKALTSVKQANQIVTSSMDSELTFNNKIEETPQFSLFSTRENLTEKVITSQYPQNDSQLKKIAASFTNQNNENSFAGEVKNQFFTPQPATESLNNSTFEKVSEQTLILHQATDLVKEPEHTTDTENLTEELTQTSTSTNDISQFFKLGNTTSTILKQPFKSISMDSNLTTSEKNISMKTNNHLVENSKVEQEIKNTEANQFSKTDSVFDFGNNLTELFPTSTVEMEIFTEQPSRDKEEKFSHKKETSSEKFNLNFIVSSTQDPAKKYGDITTTSWADQLQILRSEQVTTPGKNAAENIGPMETYDSGNEFTTKQMELETLFDTSLQHEEMEKSTKDPELEIHRTTTSEVSALNEILNVGSHSQNESSTQHLEPVTNFNISVLDEVVKTTTENLLPTIFNAKDEISEMEAAKEIKEITEETFTIDRHYTLGDYTTSSQITKEGLQTGTATTESPANILDTMESENLKQTTKYPTTQENSITEMSTLLKSPSITTIFIREPTTLTPLTAVTSLKETVHTLNKFTHLPTENDSQVVKILNETTTKPLATQQSLTDETTMMKSEDEASTMSNMLHNVGLTNDDSGHIKSQAENQLLEPLKQADILEQITESSFHVLTTILPADIDNIETKITSDQLITKKGLLVTTTEGDIVSNTMSNSFLKENCIREVETSTAEYIDESTTTVPFPDIIELPGTVMSDSEIKINKIPTQLTATIPTSIKANEENISSTTTIYNLQEMVTFNDHTDSDMDVTTMKQQQFEKEYEDEELAATNHIEEALTKASLLAAQSQSATKTEQTITSNHIEQSQQQTTPGLIYSSTISEEAYETTAVTGEPVTRSLPLPPPQLAYTQNEDGVEVFYGYSLVKHN